MSALKRLTRIAWQTLLIGMTGSAIAQSYDVPLQTQLDLYIKVLQFDRALVPKAGSQLVIGVLYQSTVIESREAKLELERIFDESSPIVVRGFPVELRSIDFRSQRGLDSAVSAEGVDIFYVLPLRAVELQHVADVSRAHHILTLTADPKYVIDGLLLGIGRKDQRPEIVINLDAAKAEGVDFPLNVLKYMHATR